MISITYIVLPIVASLAILRKYREYVWGFYKNNSSLKGQVFLVTGANSGVGKETVKQLADRQATVILACRNKQATLDAIDEIRKFTKSGELIYQELDLSSLASVRKFAAEVNEKFSKIDVLINNAGVAVPLDKDLRTSEGFEMNFGVNHLGHFLLTQQLLPKLTESAPSRIVIVASTLHEHGKIDFEDLNLDKLRASGQKFRFSPGYCNSKLANVYHARELAERLKDAKVNVCLVCPGFTYTNLFRHSGVKWWSYIVFAPVAFLFMRSARQVCDFTNPCMPTNFRELAERLKGSKINVSVLCPGFTATNLHKYSSVKWWQYIPFLPIMYLYMRSAWQGSQTIVYCATEKNLPGKSGDFYRDVNTYESKANFDNDVQKKLWKISEELVKS